MKLNQNAYFKVVDFFLKQKFFYKAIDLACLPLIPALYLGRKLFQVHVVRLWAGRFGEVSSQIEILLRRYRLGKIPKNERYVMITSTDVASQYQIDLLKKNLKNTMYNNKLHLLQIPQPKQVRAITKILAQNSILSRLKLFYVLPTERKEYYEYNAAEPAIVFPEEDEKKGKELLKQMGVKKAAPFICFHARDSLFIDSRYRKGDAKASHRNCDINNYLPAAEYLTDQGMYAIRMGSVVEKKINSKHKKVIDYATKYRSEFGDYYLLAKCKFLLGNTAGVCTVATGFNVPLALANHLTLKWPPMRKEDLFIPKKIWSKEKNRYLTFREIINSPVIHFGHADEYENAGLVLVESTAQEVLDLAKEMNERLDGTWKPAPEDEELQQKFKSLFTPDLACYGFPSRMGAKFLRENKELLE